MNCELNCLRVSQRNDNSVHPCVQLKKNFIRPAKWPMPSGGATHPSGMTRTQTSTKIQIGFHQAGSANHETTLLCRVRLEGQPTLSGMKSFAIADVFSAPVTCTVFCYRGIAHNAPHTPINEPIVLGAQHVESLRIPATTRNDSLPQPSLTQQDFVPPSTRPAQGW